MAQWAKSSPVNHSLGKCPTSLTAAWSSVGTVSIEVPSSQMTTLVSRWHKTNQHKTTLLFQVWTACLGVHCIPNPSTQETETDCCKLEVTLVYTMSSKPARTPPQKTKPNHRPAHSDFGICGFPKPIPYGYQRTARMAKFTCMHPLNNYVFERQCEEYFPEWTDFSHTMGMRWRWLWEQSFTWDAKLSEMNQEKKLFFPSSQS